MLLRSHVLPFCSCVSSCGPIAQYKDYENLKETANQVVLDAKDEFDYDGFDLTLSDQDSFVKQKLHEYAEKAELFTVTELATLKGSIESDGDYRKFEDLDTLFIKKEQEKGDTGLGLGGGLFDSSSVKNEKRDDSLAPKDNLTGPNLDYGDTSGTVKETYNFPILENELNNASITTNANILDDAFFGIYCSKESCVGLYNSFADFINRQSVYRISGSGTPLQVAAEELKSLGQLAVAKSVTAAAISVAINKMVGAFTGIFSTILNALAGASGPIGVVCALVILAIGTACILTIVSMIIFGSLGKGFAMGWIIHKNGVWEWFDGELN